jgi:xylan 1,4-beta-xylosidase
MTLKARIYTKSTAGYYLSQAEGGSMALQMQTIGRSRSPWRPFELCPHNPWLAQHRAWWHPIRSAGHADFVQAHDGSWWTVFLATRHASYGAMTILGRETFLAPVGWVDDWLVIDPLATRQLTIEADTLLNHPWPDAPARDDFDNPTIDRSFVFMTCLRPGMYSLMERPGHLRLWGQAIALAEGTQSAFVAKRQPELAMEGVTQLAFDPTSEHEEAELCVHMLKSYHYDFAISLRDGVRSVILRKNVGDIAHEASRVTVPDGAVKLKINRSGAGVERDADRYVCVRQRHRLHTPSRLRLVRTQVGEDGIPVVLNAVYRSLTPLCETR